MGGDGQPHGSRFAGLLDAERRHRASPHSFSIPRSHLRRALPVGARVKLLFGAGLGDPPPAERMWVEVDEVADGRYVGRLANEPVAITDLRHGDRVDFGPEHVAAIWREMPAAPTPDQFAIVSSGVWRGTAAPARAARVVAPDPTFSGWIVFAAQDPMAPPDDMAGFEPVTHHALVGRFRSFDSIEDEDVGSAWRWDEAALEWRLVSRG